MQLDICKACIKISYDIYKWQNQQPNVGEESMTDFFLYKFSEKVRNVYYYKFNRHEEARKTGADFEWWILTKHANFSFRVQSKKIKRDGDNYSNIAYTNRYGLQIEKLIDDSRKDNHIPLYLMFLVPKIHSNSYGYLCKIRRSQKHRYCGSFFFWSENRL